MTWLEIIAGVWILSAVLVAWFYVASLREERRRGGS